MKTFTKILTIAAVMLLGVSCTKEKVKSIRFTDPAIYEGMIALNVGETHFIEHEVVPVTATPTIEWSSEDPSVAIAENGYVTGIGAGQTKIHAKAPNGKSAEVTVQVSAINLTYWQVPGAIDVAPGYSASFEVNNIKPKGASAGNLIWEAIGDFKVSVKDTIVTVMVSGNANQGESGTLKASNIAGTGSTSTVVNYIYHKLESLSINPYKLDLNFTDNTSAELKLTFAPENATDKNVTWSVSDPAVISFDESTLTVTAMSSGTATITAKGADGQSATCTVTVNGYRISGPYGMFIGENRKCTLVDAPASTACEWSSSNPAVATIDQNGNLEGLSEGYTIISAKYGSSESTLHMRVLPESYKMTFFDWAADGKRDESGWLKGNKAVTSISIPPYGGDSVLIGYGDYIWEWAMFRAVYGVDDPFTVEGGGADAIIIPGTANARVSMTGATYGNSYVIKVSDVNGVTGSFTAKCTCGSLSFNNMNTFTNPKYGIVANGGTITISKAKINESSIYTYIFVSMNPYSSFTTTQASVYLYDEDVRSNCTIMCDVSGVVDSSNRITLKDKAAGTYNFSIKQYPSIKWSVKLTN